MSDEVLSQIEKIADVEKEVPSGYQRIVMSTGGFLGAPAVLHIRNFSVEEALELGSISQEELPIKITSLLQRIILEPDVKIDSFYEQEVAELCIHFYAAFYSNKLKEIPYNVTEQDKQWMKDNIYKGKESPEYLDWVRGIETKKLNPTYDIDLNKVEYYKVTKDFKKLIKYTNKDFYCIFQYPRFGDTALLQKAVKEKFRDQDRKFGPLYEIYTRKQDAEARLRRGENVAIEQIPYLNTEDLQAIRAYELEKTSYIITTMKGLYLTNLNGEDVSQKPLSERVELAKDPRIDFSTYQTVSETFNKLQIGPVPKVKIVNPITQMVQEIDHPFRCLELLTNIKNYRSDNASIELI